MAIAQIKQKTNQTENYPAKTHVAILYGITYLGTQVSEWEGQKRLNEQVKLTFEFPNLLAEFDGIKKPRVLSTPPMTFSYGEKAKLRKVISGMTGLASDSEFANLELDSLVGTPCLIQIVHNGEYANMNSFTTLVDGMPVPKQFNENYILDWRKFDEELFKSQPQWIIDILTKAPEWQKVLGISSNDQKIEVPEMDIDIEYTGEASPEELSNLNDSNSLNIDGKRVAVDSNIPF